MQSTSHSNFLEMSDICDNPGIICAFLALGGSDGTLSSNVWVDAIFLHLVGLLLLDRFTF